MVKIRKLGVKCREWCDVYLQAASCTRKLYLSRLTSSMYISTATRARGRLIVDLVSRQREPDKSHFTPPSNKRSAVASLPALQISYRRLADALPPVALPSPGSTFTLHLIPLLEATSRWVVENFCPPEQKSHT
jgi:hypothetical protein